MNGRDSEPADGVFGDEAMQVRTAAQTIVAGAAGTIRTHSPGCYLRHLECFAAFVLRRFPAAANGGDAVATVGTVDACNVDCRHRCPACRMGLVTHLSCDPLCGDHRAAPSNG